MKTALQYADQFVRVFIASSSFSIQNPEEFQAAITILDGYEKEYVYKFMSLAFSYYHDKEKWLLQKTRHTRRLIKAKALKDLSDDLDIPRSVILNPTKLEMKKYLLFIHQCPNLPRYMKSAEIDPLLSKKMKRLVNSIGTPTQE